MDSYPVHAVVVADEGDQFLCVTGHPQPKIYDRDGRELGELTRATCTSRLEEHQGALLAVHGRSVAPVREAHGPDILRGRLHARVGRQLSGSPEGRAGERPPGAGETGRCRSPRAATAPAAPSSPARVRRVHPDLSHRESQGFRSASVGLVMHAQRAVPLR